MHSYTVSPSGQPDSLSDSLLKHNKKHRNSCKLQAAGCRHMHSLPAQCYSAPAVEQLPLSGVAGASLATRAPPFLPSSFFSKSVQSRVGAGMRCGGRSVQVLSRVNNMQPFCNCDLQLRFCDFCRTRRGGTPFPRTQPARFLCFQK